MKVTDFKCPLCGGQMTAYPDEPRNEKSGSRDARVFGWTLRCENPCVPYVHENVYGHGVTEKEAHATACEKYRPVKE